MLLVVDVGNTQTVIGVYESLESTNLRSLWRISTVKTDSVDDLRYKLAPLFEMDNVDITAIRHSAVASVVPALSTAWSSAIEKLWGIEPLFCTANIAHGAGLFEADYPYPNEIGADRVADAIAAQALFGSPVIVVDFGTATNIEVIDAQGRFIGGIIAPGIQTGAQALFQQASRLAGTELVAPPNVVGTSTEEAIRSGIIFGEVGRVDGLIDAIFAQLEDAPSQRDVPLRECSVVATGGLAFQVAALSKRITDVSPELTLDGLRILAAQIKSKEPLC